MARASDSPRIDVHSRTWEAVSRYVQRRIETLVAQLLDPAVGHDDTQYLRGEIAGLRRLKDDLEREAGREPS